MDYEQADRDRLLALGKGVERVDHFGGVYTVTYPSPAERAYEQDPLGRLDTVREGDGTSVADYAYYDLAGRNVITYANGVTTCIEVDALRRITRVSTGVGITTVADYRYGYDAASNRTYMQRWHAAGHPADVYQYDGLYQLTQVWYGADATEPSSIASYDWLQWYDLDPLGNRLEVRNDGVGEIYQPNDGQKLTDPMNRYAQVDSEIFTYDLRGNTLADGRNTYAYDVLNRQIGMSGSGGAAEYVYDATGRRIAKIAVSGTITTTTYYVYDTRYRVIEERVGDSSLAARYTYGADIDEPLTMERSGRTTYYHRDALGSVTEMTDAADRLVERYEYDVYGEPSILDTVGNRLAVSASGNPYLFTGRNYDPEGDNYYFRARVFSPEIGRFLQVDPLRGELPLSQYSYVDNRPTLLVDPSGLAPVCRELVAVPLPQLVPPGYCGQKVLEYTFTRWHTEKEFFICWGLPGGQAACLSCSCIQRPVTTIVRICKQLKDYDVQYECREGQPGCPPSVKVWHEWRREKREELVRQEKDRIDIGHRIVWGLPCGPLGQQTCCCPTN